MGRKGKRVRLPESENSLLTQGGRVLSFFFKKKGKKREGELAKSGCARKRGAAPCSTRKKKGAARKAGWGHPGGGRTNRSSHRGEKKPSPGDLISRGKKGSGCTVLFRRGEGESNRIQCRPDEGGENAAWKGTIYVSEERRDLSSHYIKNILFAIF